MAILRKTFSQGRMQLDIENRLLPDGEYREATNVVVLNNESTSEGSVKKSFSTKKITNLNLGTNPICLGTYSYSARNRVYWLILSDTGSFLIEYDFNTNTSSFVLKDTRPLNTRVFNLKSDFYCTAMNIVSHEDINKELMLMTDNNIDPLCFNIERAKKYGENGFDKYDIFLIKRPPLQAPRVQLTYTGGLENYMEDSFQLFFYRYKYLDGEYSCFSDFTNYQFAPGRFNLDYQTLENKGMINRFNAVKIFFNIGDKRVTDIQILLKKTNSNVPYLIETFNKEEEQWNNSHNTEKSFIFSNEKIYLALPEKELFRSFDNVPRKALAQTMIGNKAIYGNYLEGYDLLNTKSRKIKLNYLLSIISKNITGVELTTLAAGQYLQILFLNIALKKDTSIRFTFKMKSRYQSGASFIDEGNFDRSLDYILNSNYTSLAQLTSDPSFVLFIEETLTSFFMSQISFNPPANGVLTNVPKFSFVVAGNLLFIFAPIFNYQIDNTPANTGDSNFTNRTYIWSFLLGSNTFYRDFTVSSSCKTNRSYGVGVLYMDDFKRKTTTLTTAKNTIYIPQDFSVNKNSIKVSIDSPAPYWATSYKFVVKQQPLSYNILYGIKFYEDGLFRWLRLEGASIDKVKQGDVLIAKSDLGGPVLKPLKFLILEKEFKKKDFLEGNGALVEEEGVYIKIKPNGIDMKYNTAIARTFTGTRSLVYPVRCFTEPIFGVINPGNVFVPYLINSGSEIKITIATRSFGTNNSYAESYTLTRRAAESYASVKEWFQAEVNNLGDFGKNFTWNGVSDIGPNIDAGFGLADQWNENSGWGWTANGASFYVVPKKTDSFTVVSVTFEILFTEGLMIFETEPKQVENESYFECSKSYGIENGLHKGDTNGQDQTSLLPAVVELDFFNCYVQGNGAESYQVKDSILKPYLNIDTKATATSIEEYKEIRRSADLTYSESFVESSNVNGLNVFNLSTANFKDDLDKEYGSIQRIQSRENDIVVLQEDKAGKVLFGRDAIYTADGNAVLTAIPEVLGRYIPYAGSRGIGKNPESFSIDDYGRIKYASVRNGVIVRLSNDGIEDITTGLRNFFRDLFVNNLKTKIISGYDAFLNLTFFSIGDGVVKTPLYNCNDQIIKAGQNTAFYYELLLNNLAGDVVFSYNITSGTATIQVVFNNVTQVVSSVTGSGTIIVPRTSLIVAKAFVTITPVSATIDYTITNTCPVGIPLEIVMVVLNDQTDATKSITNRFKTDSNSFIATEDIFTSGPLTRFESIIGSEGVDTFPANGALVTVQSLKETTNSGKFEIDNCNRLGYLISSTVYNNTQAQAILDNVNTQFLTVSESGEINFSSIVSGTFVFSRSSVNQKLYLIWDYTNRKPMLNNDAVRVRRGQSITFAVLGNDIVEPNAVLTIITPPTLGTLVVNADKTVTYTSTGSDTTPDGFTYQVTQSGCSSQASAYITITAMGVGVATSAALISNAPVETFPDGTSPCSLTADNPIYIVAQSPTALTSGDILYNDLSATNLYNGGGFRWKIRYASLNYVAAVTEAGVVNITELCV